MTQRSRLDAGMQAELEFHIESYAEDLMRSGLSREDAQRRARIELGSIPSQKEKCRESLGLRLWDDLIADLRYGLRMLQKSPGFTAIAIGSLALGIGANTIIFTFAKRALLDTLAVPHPQQLRLLAVQLSANNSAVNELWGSFYPLPGGATETTSFSYPVYQIMRQQNQSLEDLFAFKELGDYDRLNATIDGHAQAITGQLVSGNYYQGLGITTPLGRPIQPQDDAVVGRGAVAVISDALWARAFGRSSSVIGKVIELNFAPVTIVGVNPPDFTGAASTQSSPDIFLPFSMQPVLLPQGKEPLLNSKTFWWIQVMGRVKPGVSDSAALAALSVSLDQAVRATMTVKKDAVLPQLRLLPGSRGLNETGRDLHDKILVLLALTGLVLVLACANIANLLLARSAARQREIGVRIALGASWSRILRQVFTESLLLSLFGGFAGLLLGYYGRNLIPSLMSSSPWRVPLVHSRFDWKVFAFTAAISLFTGLLFGVAPALQSTRVSVNASLKDNAASATKRRKGLAGKAIVVFQVSLSVLLIAGAGLFIRTLLNLSKTDIGFRPEHILLFHIQPPVSRYPGDKQIDLDHRIEQSLAALPGVDSVTLSSLPLLAHNVSNSSFMPDGDTDKTAKHVADINLVGQGFLTTMGIPLLSGRDFNEHDTESSPRVAIINHALARQFFPNSNPVGKTFKNDDEHIQIIGICADTKYSDLRREMPATFYIPYRQAANRLDMQQGGVTYELRLKTTPESVLPAVRNAIASIDKDLPLVDVRTQTEQINALLSDERLFASLSGAFGILALALACIGIYGIMAYSVARRTNEIGIRMALGAQTGQVLRMVLSEASWLAVFGIGIGLGAALWLARFLNALLYGLKPNDPITMIASAMLLLVVALAAGFVPAWRASKVQPMEALRHE